VINYNSDVSKFDVSECFMVWKNIMKKKGKHKMKEEIRPVSYNESRRKEGFLSEGLYRQIFV